MPEAFSKAEQSLAFSFRPVSSVMVGDEEECLIAFGANQGDREGMLRRVLAELSQRGFRDCQASRLYRTRPIGGPSSPSDTVAGGNNTVGGGKDDLQAEYANAVIRARTAGSPREVVARLLEVESVCGRQRTVRWAPRTVDLDLLMLGAWQVDEPGVSLPHPRMLCRRFVLEPACELAADMRHPWSGAKLGDLAAAIGRSVRYRAVWLWPEFTAAEQQARWRIIGKHLVAAGVGAVEFQAAGARPVPVGLPESQQSRPDAARAAAGRAVALGGENWHILVVSDPLQLSQIPWSPSLMIGWQRHSANMSSAVASDSREVMIAREALIAREAVQRHLGATVLLDEEVGETGRELTAALTAVAEFWREPLWPPQPKADSAAEASSDLGSYRE
jgi:2-amino-4-hydroxy-6-hydroxymethyldihydropteridine diphosphokinase